MQTGKSKQLNLKTQYWKNPATTIFPTCQNLEAKLSVLPNYKQGMPDSVPKLLADELFLLTKSRVTGSNLLKQMTVPNTSQEHRAFVCSVLRGGGGVPTAQGNRRGNRISETSPGS